MIFHQVNGGILRNQYANLISVITPLVNREQIIFHPAEKFAKKCEDFAGGTRFYKKYQTI